MFKAKKKKINVVEINLCIVVIATGPAVCWAQTFQENLRYE